MKPLKNALLGLGAAAFFALFYLSGLFAQAEERVYDGFLRFRAGRERVSTVVFLDVDDDSIAYNGVFPWPRSVTAEGLLRLKEYGALAAIFDIEFIDKGPQGVDTIYLEQGLPADFARSFQEINSAASDIFASFRAGRIGRNALDDYAGALSALISGERDGLLARARSVARDNDRFLAQASALYGKSWVTLNLRESPLKGEQAERRAMAEERFSRPVLAGDTAWREEYVDILPPLPVFALAARGAGFTNVEVDPDGIRRRIYLIQKIQDHWYLQLAFAPLLSYLEAGEIELQKRRLVIRDAKLPGAAAEDISIPLDSGGRMMLDWPPENYLDSFRHISFAEFSLLDDIEAEMEQYGRALAAADIHFFSQFDPALARLPRIAAAMDVLFNAAEAAKTHALENCSGESFAAYVDYRAKIRSTLREIIALDPAARINALLGGLDEAFPENSKAIRSEAEYISTLVHYLGIDLGRYGEISGRMERELKDKFCILGRVDTGTTDIGVNPFWGEYVNVGTHGVVLDTILSRSFIIPLDMWWSVLFPLVFIPLFFLFTSGMPHLWRAAAGFAAAAFVTAASLLLFRFSGVFFGALGTVLALVSAVIVREIISYAGSEREKQFIRKAFSTYVSGDVVKEIISDPSRLQLGGTKRHMSAIFTDVQGFSTISEKLDPEDLVSLLNRYLTAMSDVVLDEKGTIDKYEGDAIIAFFGAPLDLPDHALRACVSAIAMKRIETELNRAIMEERLSPSPLLTRVGVNTGAMVAGNMGTGNKMNYTIMGNAVNLAARLEGVNKQYRTWILASEGTVKETGGRILTRMLDRVRVVGINEPVRLYELLEMSENATPEQRKLAEVFHQALGCFEKREWREAAEGFRESLELENGGGPGGVYLSRCEKFIAEPPDEKWDGVFNLTEK
jgi:adenylate cyclase